MDYIKRAIYGPSPQEQFRNCQQTLRRNKRQMERQLNDLKAVQRKTTRLIQSAAKSNNKEATKLYAREYKMTKKSIERTSISMATLDSISMKLNEQQQLIKLKGSMQKSTDIMKDMNQLIKLPQIGKVVQDLSRELTKSGVIDEMMSDMLDFDVEEVEDEEESEQITQILNEVLGNKSEEINSKLDSISSPIEHPQQESAVDDEEDELLNSMRQRLSALQE